MIQTRRVRLVFRVSSEHRSFCWFRLAGNDLYWGPAQGSDIDAAVATFDSRGMTLTVPEAIEVLDTERVKASFHASGEFHLKKGRHAHGRPQHWRLKEQITTPYRIAALLSKHPVLYPPFAGSLTRESTNAQVLEIDDDQSLTRHYFEFLLSPPGRFSVPATLLRLQRPEGGETMSFSLSERLILATRWFTLDPKAWFSQWHPNFEIWIYGDDAANVVNPRPLLSERFTMTTSGDRYFGR